MELAEVLDALLALAGELGVEVRRLPGAGAEEGEPAPRSGVCRLRGRVLVLLSPADPLEERVGTLARGLRIAAPATLEARWLPPALRDWLDLADASSRGSGSLDG